MRTIASESVELSTGTKLPILGLGTWQLQGSSAVNAVLRALEVGYRHIDTATAYGNEEQVGQAVAQSGIRREDIFVTTKLPPSRAGRERETLEESLEALAFGYVDLWLDPLATERQRATRRVGAASRGAGGMTDAGSRRQQLFRLAGRRASARDRPTTGCQPDRVEPALFDAGVFSHTGVMVCRSRGTARSRPPTCATPGSYESPRITA